MLLYLQSLREGAQPVPEAHLSKAFKDSSLKTVCELSATKNKEEAVQHATSEVGVKSVLLTGYICTVPSVSDGMSQYNPI